MKRVLRRVWFDHYWWLTPGLSVIALVFFVPTMTPDIRGNLTAAIIGGAVAVVFFCQKQKLAETALFEKLFTRFNKRYGTLHGALQEIRAGRLADEAEKHKVLVKYFNLCAEEFLFYEEGRIHPVAWRSWCNGMLYYVEEEHISKQWQDEIERDLSRTSYYGLTLEAIKKGADPNGLPK
jgi:hypothetical protein